MTMHKEQLPGVTCAGGPARNTAPSPQHLHDMDALYSRLAEADEAENSKVLAALAWHLYGLAGSLVADRDALRAGLRQVLTTAAGQQPRQWPAHEVLRSHLRDPQRPSQDSGPRPPSAPP